MLTWLTNSAPHKVLAARQASGWLAAHLPEVAALYGVPQPAAHHPEICTGAHIELCLEVAATLTENFSVRFAVLTHDLGKALTPAEVLPKHAGHERAGVAPLTALCDRLGLDDHSRKLALLVCEWHLHSHRAFEMNDTSVVKFLAQTGLTADAELAEHYLLACEADARGRLGRQDEPYLQGAFLRAVLVTLADYPYPAGVTMLDPEGNRIHQARVKAVKLIRSDFARPQESHC